MHGRQISQFQDDQSSRVRSAAKVYSLRQTSRLKTMTKTDIAAMSIFVIVFNRLVWRRLYAFAAERTRLD